MRSTNKSFTKVGKTFWILNSQWLCRERSLTKDYNNIISNEKNLRKYLIQVVEELGKEYTNANKETIVKKLKTVIIDILN